MHLEKGFSIVACRCHEEDVLHRSFLTHDLGLRAGTIWTVWLVLAPNWLTRDSLNHMTEITINKFRSTSAAPSFCRTPRTWEFRSLSSIRRAPDGRSHAC
mmetsp:Transcript_32485/g.107048  ORF Transcript_32485/g.107048 Transcript_32485/m.107048 type:complete len:100 (-) Transcript_32485:370-669(-)